MVVSIRISEPKDYQKILKFYKRVDSDYFPKLSEREGGLEGHIQTIIDNGGSFALYESGGSLEGAAGFFPLDENKTRVQFTFFTFSKEFRNTLAPYRLAKYLVEMRDELGYKSTKTIIARTWYKKSAERLKRVGFKQITVISGDIIPERTSYYFESNLDFIIKNIMNKKTMHKKSDKK